ncbi:solute carrier family 2, facilitated glucose transporter member 6-like [Schistocerca nitens]|uniref:solute carrier family 2, facilitated glucose transporter member 6-like n=1 Tax=Schistocerca nitens TaxID=7011 RepID=UPI002119A3F9|nr:solute carrier family 2, facilitated glucose transporter member 6-like [Schistocerca nitens]
MEIFTASLACLNAGLLVGWSSPVLPHLMSNASHIAVSADESSWLGSVGLLSMVAPSLLAAVLVDIVGRRRLLLAAAPPFLVSAVWQRFASTYWELLTALCIGSIGTGISITTMPVYAVEIAQDHTRGRLVAFGPLMMSVGALLMTIVSLNVSFFSVTEFMMACSTLFVAIFWWMPESPYFLVAKHRKEEALKALMKLRGTYSADDALDEVQQIQRAVDERTQREISAADSLRELRKDAGARRAFLNTGGQPRNALLQVSLAVSALVALCGCDPLLSSSTSFLEDSGSPLDPGQSAAATSAVRAASACACLLLVSFDMGGYPLVWVLPNDLMPASARALCNSCVFVVSSALAFTLTKLAQVVSDAGAPFAPFWVFTACALAGFSFTWYFIPETKGRSLMDISSEMNIKALGRPPNKRYHCL